MPMPTSFDEFSTRLADPIVSDQQSMIEHPRFIQVRCRLDGTHPDVQIGQVWEDLDSRRGKGGSRHVMVTKVNNDGTVDVLNVYAGEGSTQNIGAASTVAIHRFRSTGSGRGFRLRSMVIHLTDTGLPRQGFTLPKKTRLADLVKVESRTTKPKPAVKAGSSTKPQTTSATVAKPTPPASDSQKSQSKGTTTGSGVVKYEGGSGPLQGVLTTDSTTDASNRVNNFRQITDILSGGPEGPEALPIHRKMATRMLSFMSEDKAILFAKEYVWDKQDKYDFPDTPEFLSEFVSAARLWAEVRGKEQRQSVAVN